MAVTAMIWLFGKPGHELEEGGEVTGQQIRDLGTHLNDRLQEVGDIVDKLTGAGWEAQVALYDVILSHPYVRTETEARTRLDDLGIDPDKVAIFEDEEEDDFEDDEESLE